MIVGTQALLSEGVAFHDLGLVIVDEQHRFGVEQRHALAERARDATGRAAHILYMTATPIPRTLALTAYGELAVSTIRGRPAGRGPVATRWVRDSEREEAYAEIRAELRQGYQAYVICPLVDEGGSAEAKAATEEAERLRSGPFAEFAVGLVHGALKSDAKRAAMAAFARGETDVLVATTVIEVGIDVPNASIILIEGADRFGLAQLHQLRGRVGRGERPGQCIVFGEPTTDDGMRRLEAFTQTGDGFRLAELDLEIRGEGSMLGNRQAGPTDLRFARLTRDRRELAQARQIARRLLRAIRACRGPNICSCGAPSRRGLPRFPGCWRHRRVRVVAGTHRGRRLRAPRGALTRPTSDRVREALFAVIGDCTGCDVLDLFAGSGPWASKRSHVVPAAQRSSTAIPGPSRAFAQTSPRSLWRVLPRVVASRLADGARPRGAARGALRLVSDRPPI